MERGVKQSVVNRGRTVGYHTKVISVRTGETRLSSISVFWYCGWLIVIPIRNLNDGREGTDGREHIYIKGKGTQLTKKQYVS